MNLLSSREVKNRLKIQKLWPKKRLGQNFLISSQVLDKILQASELKRSDVVVEVGAGLGTLTQALAQKTKKVIAVEKDPALIPLLKENLKEYKNVEIICADILEVIKNFKSNYKVIGNIPYYLTSRLLRLITENLSKRNQDFGVELAVLTVQKEIAKRIVAKPPKMNILAVAVNLYANSEIVANVPKVAFWPQPKVDSAIIRLKPKNISFDLEPENFFKVLKAGFSSPRKKVINNFSRKFNLPKDLMLEGFKNCSLAPSLRAGEIDLQGWMCLGRYFANKI